jgi:hypothetical protein
MSRRHNKLVHILVAGAALAALSGPLDARDPGINQPGVRGGAAGVGAPGVGVRDPGINQPGAAGNVGSVARRTARRSIVATSVIVATLPAGCRTVVIEGTTLQQCGGTYYQPSGNQYVVVEVK